MFWRILKKDLKRKKTMNIILLLFIILSSVFVASGLNNVITVINGTDYYLDQAGVGDYVLITMGENVVGGMEKILADIPAVENYRIENVVAGSQENITAIDGSSVKTKNALLIQSIDDTQIHLFNMENEKLDTVSPGHVYVSGNFMEENNLEAGDQICIKISEAELTLTLDGKVKDALLGSVFMGNTRFILNETDMEQLLDDEIVALYYQGEVAYIDTDDVQAMASAAAGIPNVTFDGTRSIIKMCYVMDMIVAFVILILSVCLMIVSFVVLKFSITFTIAEEYREIGVMKAIGIRNSKIRSMYIIKYFILAASGSLIGFIFSIPFGRLLLQSVTENMMLGSKSGVLANVFGAALVILVIALFAYLCTNKVKKLTPVDAVRAGQTGERYRKKTIYRIGRSHIGTEWYMAANDVISSPRRFATIIISFSICTLFVLILVNTTSTMKSSNLISAFGTESDLYVTDVGETMNYMVGHTKSDMEAHLKDMGEELTQLGMPAQVVVEIMYKNTVSFEGNDYSLTCIQGLGTEMNEYEYLEGLIPENKNEIAITDQISEMTGAEIGDIVTIDFGNEKLDCIVTAYFQSMNQLGQVIRLYKDAPVSFDNILAIMSYQINFTDNPSDEEIEIRKERIKEYYHNDAVVNATEYCIDTIGVVDTMEAVQLLLLSITLIVVVLVTVLMERSFIADEKSQIAILKAIGFQNRAIILWHTLRFGIVAAVSVLLAAVLSIPATNLCITPVFGMMGAVDVTYNIEPLKVFVIYPGMVFLVTICTTWITAGYTRTITSRDTADIE